jgi:hypothetical protein
VLTRHAAGVEIMMNRRDFDDVCAVENAPGEAERRLWQTI